MQRPGREGAAVAPVEAEARRLDVLRRHPWLPVLSLVAAAAVLRWVAWLRTAAMFNDGPLFLALARRMADGEWSAAVAHDYHPLYPLAIRLAYPLAGDWERAAAAVSVLAGAAAVALLYRFLRDAFDARVALVGAALLAVHPYAISNKWCNRHGKPVDNTDLWREFVRVYEKVRKAISIEKVKGHGKGLQKDPHNYTADKLAEASSDNPLTRTEYRSSVRRKTSPQETDVGSIGMHGQQMLIRVIENVPMRRHKLTKYRCEVVSTDSPYFQNVDWLYSKEYMRDGHCYEVQLNDDPRNPKIVEMLRELNSGDNGESTVNQ